MKKLLILLLLPLTALADSFGENSQDMSTNSNTVVGISSSVPKVANSAIAPAVNSLVICPIVSPASKAGSVFFFSGSGTTGVTLNAICVAYHLDNQALVHQIACDQSQEYKQAALKLGVDCHQ